MKIFARPKTLTDTIRGWEVVVVDRDLVAVVDYATLKSVLLKPRLVKSHG